MNSKEFEFIFNSQYGNAGRLENNGIKTRPLHQR